MSTLEGKEIAVLRAAFEDAPLDFWVRDALDRCVVINATARRRWGECLGKSCDEAPVPPEVRTLWKTSNARARGGELVQVDSAFALDGELRHFKVVVAPLHADGGVTGSIGFAIETTDCVRAERALRESERRLREALCVGRMGYLDWDLGTNHIRWSPETYRMFGHPLSFRPTYEATVDMVPLEDRAFVEERVMAAVAGTAPYDLVHRLMRPDGQVIHVQAQGDVMRDENGQAVRVLGTVVDVTARVRAEEALRVSEERLTQALNAASAGVWEWSFHTNEVVGSRENRALYGFEPDGPPPPASAWTERVHEEDRPRVVARMREAVAGLAATYRDEFRVVHPTLGVRWLLSIGQLQHGPTGEPLSVRGITLDITDRRRAEDELREVDRRRTDFLGVLSHELRNPLTPIRNSLHILENSRPGAEAGTRALATLKRQVTHLSRLVDDLLDATRVASGKVRLQRELVDLVEVVRRTVDDHRAVLSGRALSVRLPDAVWVNADPARLTQVLGNLLQNAAKFTEEGDAVALTLSKADGRAIVEVSDTGVGIDAETLNGLFVPFTQGDRSLDRSGGGLGLGLALVKSLVELHGGTVRAASDGPGRGARFTVELPLEATMPEAVAPRPAQVGVGAARRVLIIEDNVDVAHSLADVVQLSGHETAVAFDGASGVEKARELTPDIVLCDIGLPGAIDGYAVAQRLRQDLKLRHAYCIALTGYARPEDQLRAREAGFDAHLAKPPDPAVLQQLLASAPTRRTLSFNTP